MNNDINTDTSDDRVRERGLDIANRYPITYDGECWLVPDASRRTFRFRVILNDDLPECRCTCPDYAETWVPCCHVHAARFARLRDMGGTVPPSEYPAAVPPGAPAWVTSELMRETYRVWHLHYPERLTPPQVLALIIHVSRLAEF